MARETLRAIKQTIKARSMPGVNHTLITQRADALRQA
jgi:hypothetical protein